MHIDHLDHDISLRQSDQEEFRYSLISSFISKIPNLNAVSGRGGPLKPLPGGVYRINDRMIDDYQNEIYSSHASNLGALLANRVARENKIPAFISDPVTTDEFIPEARISGVPGIERKSRSHALNIKYCVRKTSTSIGISEEDSRFVVLHLGSGFSIAAVSGGRIIDVNDALLGMGPFSVERAGALPLSGLLDMVYQSEMTEKEIRHLLTCESGPKGYLNTNDFRQVIQMASTNKDAQTVLDSMIHQIIKESGSMFAILKGNVHGLILTGGLAKSDELCSRLKASITFISTFFIYPGAFELEALAEGTYRALSGLCPILEYK